MTERQLTFQYRNWRGETATRLILPHRIWFGSTKWHPQRQWLLSGFDLEKCAERDFALLDMRFITENADG